MGMRLLHAEVDGQEIPAVMLGDDVRDARGWCSAWSGEEFASERLAALREAAPGFPVLPGYDRIGPCVHAPSQILAVGLNYRSHAEESNMAVPDEPVCFTKSVHSISGPNDDVVMPAGATKLDWEVEVALIIGRPTYQVDVEEAGKSIAGYCLANDVSERVWQLERAGQWLKGKSAPTFCPIGPWFVPAEDLHDPDNIALELAVNGVTRQAASTAAMIFSFREIVSSLSQYLTLHPGDVILTGTPEGVGMATDDYLAPGDVMSLSAEGLGTQRAVVVAQPR